MNTNIGKTQVTIGTIFTIISTIATILNGQNGSLTDMQNLLAIASVGIPGLVALLSGLFPKARDIIQKLGDWSLSLITHLQSPTPVDPATPVNPANPTIPVTPVTPSVNTPNTPVPAQIDKRFVVSMAANGEYKMSPIQETDLDALNHLAYRAAAGDTLDDRKLLTLCSQLNTTLFNLHHNIKGTDVDAGLVKLNSSETK